MKLPKFVANTHEWHKSVLVRLLLVLSSLFTLVMASGATSQWW